MRRGGEGCVEKVSGKGQFSVGGSADSLLRARRHLAGCPQ